MLESSGSIISVRFMRALARSASPSAMSAYALYASTPGLFWSRSKIASARLSVTSAARRAAAALPTTLEPHRHQDAPLGRLTRLSAHPAGTHGHRRPHHQYRFRRVNL